MSRSPKFSNLTLNNKYRKLKPPLSFSDHQALEKDIRTNRCELPIIVWKKNILDGYKRYDICKTYNIRPRIKNMTFEYEEEAVCWICRHELERENLTESFSKYLIGTYYHAKKDLLAKKYPMKTISPHFESSRPPIGDLVSNKSYTLTVVCQELGISAGSLANYRRFAADIDRIRTRSEQLVEMFLTEQIITTQAAVSRLVSLSFDEFEKVHQYLISTHPTYFNQSQINSLIEPKVLPAQNKPSEPDFSIIPKDLPMKRLIKEKLTEPAIKLVPAYDPDAELSSLTLTIPSWISSISRSLNASPLEQTTSEAKRKLNLQLYELQKVIINTQIEIMENYND